MKNRVGSVIRVAFIFAVLLLLTACAGKSVDELYSLPQGADEYLDLQKKINLLLYNGAEYSPPTSGSYRQSVQLEDLDGDGVSEELVFMNVSGDDRPLKIYIFNEKDDEFYEAAVIEGEGTNIESINYVDMDNDGTTEIVVGRQISSSVKMLTVYSSKGFQISTLINTDYVEYSVCSLTETEGADLLVIRSSAPDQAKEVNVMSCMEDGEVITSGTRLSMGAETVSRIRNTKLSDGVSAVMVEGTLSDGSLYTDVFAEIDGKVKNITMDAGTGVSESTLRGNVVYCRDINDDGIVEIPNLIQMPSQNETTSYWLTEWYAYSSNGKRELVMTSFNNTTDGWMLAVPEEWTGKLTVRRAEYVSGERSVLFSYIDNSGEIHDFLSIYTLSGENKTERSKMPGRFVLVTESERIFAARIFDSETTELIGVTADMVKENFSIIYSEWNTGET